MYFGAKFQATADATIYAQYGQIKYYKIGCVGFDNAQADDKSIISKTVNNLTSLTGLDTTRFVTL